MILTTDFGDMKTIWIFEMFEHGVATFPGFIVEADTAEQAEQKVNEQIPEHKRPFTTWHAKSYLKLE